MTLAPNPNLDVAQGRPAKQEYAGKTSTREQLADWCPKDDQFTYGTVANGCRNTLIRLAAPVTGVLFAGKYASNDSWASGMGE
ncbi:MAG: hypothetical protein ACHP8A_11495 [Terriglobales bacterium]